MGSLVTEKEEDKWPALMEAAQNGDSGAYTRLLREVALLVRRVVRSRLPGSADAEDVTQDVLLSLHAVRHTYDPARPFLPWVMAIVRNRLVDHWRRVGRRAEHEVVVEKLPETFADEATNTMESAWADGDVLRRAVAALPPGQRQAIEMLKLKEMSLKEASAASGMSVGALKVATHRAVKALRTALNKEP